MAIDTSDKKNPQKPKPQGFQSQSPTKSEGADQALALASGLEQTLLAQASSVAELAQKTALAADAIAEPIAEFVAQVSNGDLLMSKIAEKVNALSPTGESFGAADVSVTAPSMPALPSAKISDNFFAQPKRITGV